MPDPTTPDGPDPGSPTPDGPGPAGRKPLPPALGLIIVVALLTATAVIIASKRSPIRNASPGATPPAQRPHNASTGQLERIDDEFDLAGLTLDREHIVSPSPNKDDIPSLTTADARPPGYQPPDHHHWEGHRPPAVVNASEDHLVPDDTDIIGVTVNGESRAYPHTLLDRHECINDTLGGVPIAVTYCPLCDSATIFDRRMGKGDQQVTLEFGVSGLLYNSNVLLYDRTHHALWSQVQLTAVSGPFAGQPLRYLDGWAITTLGQWKQKHPDTTLVTYDTGLRRYPAWAYERRGYPDYFEHDMLMFPVTREDDRLPNKTPVIGVVLGDTRRAYLVSAIQGQWQDTLGTDATLTLQGDGQGGVAVVDMPEGTQVTHTYWYAWVAFHPETELVTQMPTDD